MSKTFPVAVEGVGDFTFRRRAIRDQIRIEAEIERILGGPSDHDGLKFTARAVATIGVLKAAVPDGFDVDAVDPFDDDAVGEVLKVYRGLCSAEETFRRGSAA